MASPKRAELPANLKAAARHAAVGIRRVHEGDLDRDTAERIGRLIAALLRPRARPGRKLTEAVGIALTLRRQGKPWTHIYPRSIPGYAEIEPHERRYREQLLRRNVREVRKRAQKQEAPETGT